MNSKLPDIQVVDDDRVSLMLLQKILQHQGYNVDVSSDPLEAIERIQQSPPNVLLTDWSMPQMNGGELCQAVRKLNLPRYIYTIVLTANTQDFVVEALDAGADDFLTKPVDPNELTARMNAGRRILDLEDRLKMLTEFDALTGLLNRPTFFDRFERAFQKAQETQATLSCVMLDLDRFKMINDVYGHLAGDTVLQEVGGMLREIVTDEALVGRYGGEEFILGLPRTTSAEAEEITETIRCRLAAQPFNFGAAQDYRVTASFGVSQFNPSFQNLPQFINSADQNLLTAKRMGRNRTVSGQLG